MAIIPGMTELTRPYWDAAREGRLVVQECDQRIVFAPRVKVP